MPPIRRRLLKGRRAFLPGPRGAFGPLQLKANLEMKHQFRFLSSSATATAISDATLLNECGVVANTAGTTGYNIFKTVKVNRIELWSPPASQGSAVTCSVLFPSGNNAPSREYSDTSVSVSEPAHVVCSPPPQSLAGFWQNGVSGVSLFTLVAPAGTIIDVWVSLVLNDGTATSGNTATLVAGIVGVVYYCSLDSSTAAGSLYAPISLITK